MMTTLIQVERSNKPMLLTATAEAAASSPKISLGRRWLTPFGRGGRFGYSAKAQARQQIGRALDGLMPSNHNHVCFDCRVNVRRAKVSTGPVLCPTCGGACRSLGYKIPIPPKQGIKAWTDLWETIRSREVNALVHAQEARTRRIHELERHIDELERRPAAPGSDKTIRELQSTLAHARSTHV
jgi:hypothetical protein